MILEQMEQVEQVEQVRGVIEDPLNNAQIVEKREIQCKSMVMTVNHWTVEQKQKVLEFFEEFCERYVMGEEIGHCTKTPHLQCAFTLKRKDRFSGIHNKLGIDNAWIVKMKGKWSDQKYCMKGENVIQFFTNPADELESPEELTCLSEEELYPWQKQALEMLKGPRDNRTVNWYWEKTGNVGKTAFTRYLGIKHNACIIQKGKYADIMNHVFMSKNVKIFIIDVPRSSGNSVSYNAIESIKSGIIFNSKYETGQKFINPPHIIVFSNEEPDMQKLSADRWNIVKIE